MMQWMADNPWWANFLLGYGFGSVIQDAVKLFFAARPRR
jgi:hypothetical protein